MQGSTRKDVVFGAARVYTVTLPGPKWKSWFNALLTKPYILVSLVAALFDDAFQQLRRETLFHDVQGISEDHAFHTGSPREPLPAALFREESVGSLRSSSTCDMSLNFFNMR